MMLCPSYFYNDVRAEIAEALAGTLPAHLPHFFLSNSGAEAVEARSSSRGCHGAAAFRRGDQRVPRPDARRAVGHVEAEYREAFAAARCGARPFNDAAALDSGDQRRDGRRHPGSGAGRERRQRRQRRISRAARGCARARRDADRRRDPDRLRAHRALVRMPARRPRARHLAWARASRRRADGRVRVGAGSRGAASRARTAHLRRQSAGLRGLGWRRLKRTARSAHRASAPLGAACWRGCARRRRARSSARCAASG